MNNKRKSNLWLLFVVIVLAVTIMTFIILGAAMAILFALGIIPTQQQLAPFPFIMLILLSIILGTSISLIIGRIILKPVDKLSNGLERVAKGDFSIRLDEKTNVKEISRIYENFNAMTQELS